MSTLEDLHDGAIMHNLFLRYQQRHVYVSVAQLQTKRQLWTQQNVPGAIRTPDVGADGEVLRTGIPVPGVLARVLETGRSCWVWNKTTSSLKLTFTFALWWLLLR